VRSGPVRTLDAGARTRRPDGNFCSTRAFQSSCIASGPIRSAISFPLCCNDARHRITSRQLRSLRAFLATMCSGHHFAPDSGSQTTGENCLPLGGEEICLLLDSIPAKTRACRRAESVRQAIFQLPHGRSTPSGLPQLRRPRRPRRLRTRANWSTQPTQLAAGKHAGRDQIARWSEYSAQFPAWRHPRYATLFENIMARDLMTHMSSALAARVMSADRRCARDSIAVSVGT